MYLSTITEIYSWLIIAVMLYIIFSKTIFRLKNLNFALFALNNSRQSKERARKLNFQFSDVPRFSDSFQINCDSLNHAVNVESFKMCQMFNIN